MPPRLPVDRDVGAVAFPQGRETFGLRRVDHGVSAASTEEDVSALQAGWRRRLERDHRAQKHCASQEARATKEQAAADVRAVRKPHGDDAIGIERVRRRGGFYK